MFLSSICNISVGSIENSTHWSLREYNRVTGTEFKGKKNEIYIISAFPKLLCLVLLSRFISAVTASFSLHSCFPEKALSSGGFRGRC